MTHMIQKIFTIIIIIIIFSVGIFSWKYDSFQSKIITQKDTIVIIEKGETFYNISEKIPHISETFLKYYLKNNPPHYELQAGRYKVPNGSTIEDIIISLEQPIYIQSKITLLEGWNIYDIDEYLSVQGIISEGAYIEYVQNPKKIQALSEFYDFLTPSLISLEGFLYPDTYQIDTANFGINKLVIQQLDAFSTKVYKPILSHLDTETVYDVVNLASIVEKEERNPKEKSTVAGILKKRLNEGWMLGADITVCYPYELTSEACKLVVSKYIYEKNDYNTRTKRGLPKTPIGNPSTQTVEATLNDTETPYYFYLHDTVTGKIYYATTNADHEYNKRNYLR
ncbi:endolytic transglycosylase MltG [Candidatus Gracilibacteria bacterium]|nr:endolytic transglycosylase MltG [Candidatus Gracilibacteria bacterium]